MLDAPNPAQHKGKSEELSRDSGERTTSATERPRSSATVPDGSKRATGRRRQMSGIAKNGGADAVAPTVDIGILTIRDDEFRAVLEAFPSSAGVHQGVREYTLRYAKTADGSRYTIAILRQIEQGNGEAQDAARDLLEDLDPSLLMVIGIAGGLPSDDITLGDVVISTRVNDYSVEARKTRSKPTYSLSG